MMLVLSWLLPVGASIIFLILVFYRPRKLHLPPGPKPWPIIGNFNLISSLPHLSIHHLSQIYGPIMQLQFGSFPVVVASSSDMAKQFLKIHDLNFASRPKSSVGLYTAYDHSNIVFSPFNRYWRYARKICSVELFNTKRLDSYEYIRVEEMRNFLSDMYVSCGKEIPLRDYFSKVTLNNITRIVLGKTLLEGSRSENFKKMLKEMFFLAGVLNIGDFIPWLDFLDLQGHVKRFKAVAKSMEKFLEEELNEHIARKHMDSQDDMLDVLLKLADDPNADVKLSRNQIKSITMDLLAGGTDTSLTTIEWAMSEILKRPEVFRRATEELDRVIGRGRWVEEHDILNLPYIKAIVYETMRMHPVSPMLAPHLGRENCKIQGYDIAEGTQVLVNVWSIGRDPTLWDAPNEFRPERFMGRDIDVRGQHFELLPFGSGRRMCPGYSLGLKLTECGIANLLHGFIWELPNGMKPQDLDMGEVWGLTVSRKVQLLVVSEPRLPSHVYMM